MLLKSADGCSEHNKYQGEQVPLFLSTLTSYFLRSSTEMPDFHGRRNGILRGGHSIIFHLPEDSSCRR